MEYGSNHGITCATDDPTPTPTSNESPMSIGYVVSEIWGDPHQQLWKKW